MPHTERVGSSKRLRFVGSAGKASMTDRGTSSVYDAGAIPGFISSEIAKWRTTHTHSIFTYLEKNGIATHLVSDIGGPTLIVRECQVLDRPSMSGKTFGRHLNLELLFRVRVSEKFRDRILSGEVSREAVGLQPTQKITVGMKLPKVYVEASTKWEPSDRYLDDNEAAQIAELSTSDYLKLKVQVAKIAALIDTLFEKAGYTLYDGKVEMAITPAGEFVVIDGISLDELGVRNHQSQPYDKNFLRWYYQAHEPEWYKALMAAKKAYPFEPKRWPTCPEPSDGHKRLHEKHYEEVARALQDAVRSY